MIPVDEVEVVSSEHRRIGEVIEVDMLALSDDEQVAFDFVDAQLDAQALSLQCDMFVASIPSTMASDRVVGALKLAWEAGGWIAGAFPVGGGYQFVLARGRVDSSSMVAKALKIREENDFPLASTSVTRVVVEGREPKMSTPLLVRMPTRGRPEQALRVLQRYRSMAQSHVAIEVVIDTDDEMMNCALVLQQLCDLDVVITVGNHKSKIEAVNGGRVDDWSILVLASDDMCPVVQGYDARIVEEMNKHFPLRDGALNFNDSYNRDHVRSGQPILNTLPIIGRHLWEQFGYVYHPSYGSLYVDDEFTELMTQMRRLVFIDDVIIEHRHYAAGKAPKDVLYTHNDDKWGTLDKQLFEQRSQLRQPNSQFAFDAPPLLLSILICTIPERADMLRRLVAELRWQMRRFPREVEICVDDRIDVTVGEKRQALLGRAVGYYIAFVDDDDWVASDYVRRITETLQQYRPDCLSLVGEMTTNGGRVERFEHSINFDGWYTRDGVHYRTPNHLSVVRRELALQVGFVAKNVGEDHDYSTRLRPLLNVEANTGKAPLYFYFYRHANSVQTRKGA